MSLQQGRRVRDLVIKDRIGGGGMGVIWRAWDTSRGRYVAIKSVTNDLVADPNFKHRFLDEARRHASLAHPNIVPVLDVFEIDGQSCFVMELIEGRSLSDLLNARAKHRMDAAEAIPIVQDALTALDYAHRHGIVHRDVKPSNILIDTRNRAHLIDFGIALAVGEARRTRTGLALGTPLYMSPEQISRPNEIDHRSDVYSVGCVFYEMLTGRPPFVAAPQERGDTDFAIKQAHIKESPVPPWERAPNIPAGIGRIIMRALEKDPAVRLPGCREFSRLLSQGDTGENEGVGLIARVVLGGRPLPAWVWPAFWGAAILLFVLTLIYVWLL
jgi:eukaryotic-like serine/threonine-protein kinase